MEEIWKKCWPGYEASTFGRIRSLPQYYRSGSILKPLITNRGYFCVKLYVDTVQTTHRVHRLVAETFIPNPESLATVNHKDFNKLNNEVTNLEWLSAEANYEGAKAAGRILKGSAHQNSKLSEADVLFIKQAIADEVAIDNLAEHFGVGRGTVNQIANNKTWVHVPWPEGFAPNLSNKHKAGIACNTQFVDADILAIRLAFRNGVSAADLARLHSSTRGTISQIVNNKTWRHLL